MIAPHAAYRASRPSKMGAGRGDDSGSEDDAFGEAHISDDEAYDPNAIEEETDEDEDGGNATVMSPSKIKAVKEEKKRLRELKKSQRAALERTRETQNALIAKVRRVPGPDDDDDAPNNPSRPGFGASIWFRAERKTGVTKNRANG